MNNKRRAGSFEDYGSEAPPLSGQSWTVAARASFFDAISGASLARSFAYSVPKAKCHNHNKSIMKTTPKLLITGLILLALATLNLQFSTAFAQGSLTPPGAPAPTMKSLDQIYAQIGTVQDQRTIVNATNTPGDSGDSFIISQPGSYYLTTNLVGVSGKNGILITANNVTLDLNGFALQGVSGSGNGIYIPNVQTNLTVRNGTINGWGNQGIYGASPPLMNFVLERLNIIANNNYGVVITGYGVVRDCNFSFNVADGIDFDGGGVISDCTADNNGYDGFSVICSVVSRCCAQNNGNRGILVQSGTVSGCIVQNNHSSGIFMYLTGNEVIGNTCIGNNTATSSSAAGISINGSNNRIEDNHVSASGYAGILTYNNSSYTNNITIKNSVSGDSANNYVTPNAQIVGPFITTTGTITSSNPWANFSF